MGAAGSTQATPVVVVTDGACSGNPGPGGWAAILRYETPEKVLHEKVLQGGASLTTNNRMELRAALAAFQALKRPSAVTVYTDSEYLRKGITEWLPRWVQNGWRTQSKEPVKNQDLWRALQNAMRPHSVSWQWVKGHAGNELNERADALAVNALNTIGVQAQPDMDGPPSGILI